MKKKFINVDGKKFYVRHLYGYVKSYEYRFESEKYKHSITIAPDDNYTDGWSCEVNICEKENDYIISSHIFAVDFDQKKKSLACREVLNKAYEYVSGSVYKDDAEYYKPTQEVKIHYTEPCTLLETILYYSCEDKPDVRIHNKEETRLAGYTFFGLNKAIEHGLIDADDLSGSDWVCSWEE